MRSGTARSSPTTALKVEGVPESKIKELMAQAEEALLKAKLPSPIGLQGFHEPYPHFERRTPLHTACEALAPTTIHHFVLAGASVIEPDEEGRTPFHALLRAFVASVRTRSACMRSMR